jgi:hypothetical protein
VDLDQRVHSQALRFSDQCAGGRIIDQREHHQHCVGARDPCFDDLPPVEEEILGEDGAVEFAPGKPKIVERAAEVPAFDEDAERVGNSFIAACDLGYVRLGPDGAARRRRLLDLENEAAAGLSESVGKAPVRACGAAPQRIQADAVEAARKIGAPRLRDLGENTLSHGSPP